MRKGEGYYLAQPAGMEMTVLKTGPAPTRSCFGALLSAEYRRKSHEALLILMNNSITSRSNSTLPTMACSAWQLGMLARYRYALPVLPRQRLSPKDIAEDTRPFARQCCCTAQRLK